MDALNLSTTTATGETVSAKLLPPRAAESANALTEAPASLSPVLPVVGGGPLVNAAAPAALGYALGAGVAPERVRLRLVAASMAAGGLYIGGRGFPWYFLWMLLLPAVTPRFSLLLCAALPPLYYLRHQHPWFVRVRHLPVCVLLIAEAVWRRRCARAGSEGEVMPHAA